MLAIQKILVKIAEAGLIEEETCKELDVELATPLVILDDSKVAIDWSNK
jgi:hypothetical protein